MNTLSRNKWSWIILSKTGILKIFSQNHKTVKNHKWSLTCMSQNVT